MIVFAKPLLGAVGILATLVAVGGATQGTTARWLDSERLDGGTLRSGELSLLNGDATAQRTDYPFTALAGAGLAPGAWSQAPLTVSNGGTADLDYRLASVSATDPAGLAASLTLRVQTVTGATNCPAGIGAAVPTGPGVLLYDGPLLTAATAPPRPLTVGARESICLRVALPVSVPDSAQARATSITFTFAAVST